MYKDSVFEGPQVCQAKKQDIKLIKKDQIKTYIKIKNIKHQNQ